MELNTPTPNRNPVNPRLQNAPGSRGYVDSNQRQTPSGGASNDRSNLQFSASGMSSDNA
jgi:hypothetical protein